MSAASLHLTHSNTIDLIIPHLYLTSVEQATDVDQLKNLNITHILTIEDFPLNEKIQEQFVYQFKKLSDFMFNNVIDLLEECIEFIDSAIQNSNNILVHCMAGISRSASVVIAYIMSKNRITYKEAYQLVKQKRLVRPNPGFVHQLQLFEIMNFRVDKDSIVYKTFKLDNLTYFVDYDGERDINFKDLYTPSKINPQNEDAILYNCKNCECGLFHDKNVIHHLKGQNFRSFFKRSDRLDTYKKLNSIQTCSEESECLKCINKEFYVEPLDWFITKLESNNNREIQCPSCEIKIGYYNLSGDGCTCEAWIKPAFYIDSNLIEIQQSKK